MVSSSKMEIKKFNGKIFELWKLKMEDLLVEKYQWIVVDPCTTPRGTLAEDWKNLDRKAKRRIWLCLSDSVLLNVLEEATSKALWDKLGTLYQSKYPVNKRFLQKLYKLRIKYGDKCISLLCYLPDLWDSLVVAICSNTTTLSFNDVVTSLLLEEMIHNNMEGQSTYALVARGRSQERNRSNSSSGRYKSKGRSKSPTRFVKVCWRCGNKGTTRSNVDPKALREGRDMKMILLQKKKPPRKKEGMCTWLHQHTCRS
jgi:hypothetical protein